MDDLPDPGQPAPEVVPFFVGEKKRKKRPLAVLQARKKRARKASSFIDDVET